MTWLMRRVGELRGSRRGTVQQISEEHGCLFRGRRSWLDRKIPLSTMGMDIPVWMMLEGYTTATLPFKSPLLRLRSLKRRLLRPVLPLYRNLFTFHSPQLDRILRRRNDLPISLSLP